MLRGQKRKNWLLYNISKNQSLKSIKRRDMEFPALFDLKKVLFLSPIFLPGYAHLVGTLDVPFAGVDFSAAFQSLTAPKKWFFGRLFLFFEFVPSLCPLQMGLRS